MSLPIHIRDAINLYIPPLEGWCLPERACEIAEVILDMKPKVVVEIGVFGGRSMIAQGFALRQNANGGKIYGIDPWKKEAALEGESEANREWWGKHIDMHLIHQKMIEAVWAHNLDEWVTIIRNTSQNVYELFPKIQVLTIDGSHTEEASCRDVQNYIPRLVEGGICFFDDVDWSIPTADGTLVNTTRKALKMIEQDCELIRQLDNMRVYRKR